MMQVNVSGVPGGEHPEGEMGRRNASFAAADRWHRVAAGPPSATNAAHDEERLFSPRSTAAMALSSISQTFSMGSETAAYESNKPSTTHPSNSFVPSTSPDNDDRLPFLPSSATTTSAPPHPHPPFRCVPDPLSSTTKARNHFYPPGGPSFASSPSLQSLGGAAELFQTESSNQHPPPYTTSTPEPSMMDRSFSNESQMHHKTIYQPPQAHPPPPMPHPQPYPPPFTPHLPPSHDGRRRGVMNHFPNHPPPTLDAASSYHRTVAWSEPSTPWMSYPVPHMMYPCYSMPQPQPSNTALPGNFMGRLPPMHHPSYSVTPTPHKKPKLSMGDATTTTTTCMPPYHFAPPTTTTTYSHVKAPPPPSSSQQKEVSDQSTAPERYNRKNKSLGVLAETFLKHFTSSGDGQEIIIDQLAAELAVERRRIYDVVNILEALQVVVKMGKNTYHWMGREHLVRQFALLQQEGIVQWPERAAKAGLSLAAQGVANEPAPHKDDAVAPPPVTTVMEWKGGTADAGGGGGNKSLTRLSQMFLQVFLIGVEPVSLPQASDLIHGRPSSPAELVALGMKPGEAYPTDAKTFQQIATRGLKTKIRRLYDIANVFLSIGLLRKSEYRLSPSPDGKRPQYHFQYHLSLQDIRAVYGQLPAFMIQNQSPFSERQLRLLEVSSAQHPPLNFFGQPTESNSTTTTTAAVQGSRLPDATRSPSLESTTPEHLPTDSTDDEIPSDAAADSPVASLKEGAYEAEEEEEDHVVLGGLGPLTSPVGEEPRTTQNVTPPDGNYVLPPRRNDASSPRRVSLSVHAQDE